jgi:SAM-dependent methyltransferase
VLAPSSGEPLVTLRVDIPHSARMYDYYLDGKTNYPADRAAAEQALSAFPTLGLYARQNRAFLHRAVRHLAEQAGIDQFLDIGAGIPTPPNLHEVVQAVTPKARVVYVDNDPIVLAHSRALLASSPEGRTAYLEADLNHPADILSSPILTATLDLATPVALSLIAILHFFPTATDPGALVAQLAEALAPGSYLVLSHGTGDIAPEETQRVVDVYNQRGIPFQTRSGAELAELVPVGMEIVEPGIQLLHRWRPDTDPEQVSDADVSAYGLIACKH